MAEPFPTREATRLLKEEWGISELPVRPMEIARLCEVACEPMPSSSPGVSGMLVRTGSTFGILYDTRIQVPGFQNFSVAHELGHLYLPDHPQKVFTNNLHRSSSGFASENKYEKEADQFACGLLMPSFLFDPALDKAGEGLDAILELSKMCCTSVTATAIRYAQRHPDPTAIVVSSSGVIEYCFMSEELKEYRGVRWPKRGESVPRGTVTKKFTYDLVVRCERMEGESDLSVWFKSGRGGKVYEEALGLGEYGKVLTVLSCSELPDPDEVDEEDYLERSWTPRFRK